MSKFDLELDLTRQALAEIEEDNPKYARELGQNMHSGIAASTTGSKGTISILTKKRLDYNAAAYVALGTFYPKYSSSEEAADSYFKAAKRTLNIWESELRDIWRLFESHFAEDEPFGHVDITFYTKRIYIVSLSIDFRIGREAFQYVFRINFPEPKKFELLNVSRGYKADLEWPVGRIGDHVTYTELLQKGLVAARPKYHVEDLYSLAEDMISVIP